MWLTAAANDPKGTNPFALHSSVANTPAFSTDASLAYLSRARAQGRFSWPNKCSETRVVGGGAERTHWWVGRTTSISGHWPSSCYRLLFFGKQDSANAREKVSNPPMCRPVGSAPPPTTLVSRPVPCIISDSSYIGLFPCTTPSPRYISLSMTLDRHALTAVIGEKACVASGESKDRRKVS